MGPRSCDRGKGGFFAGIESFDFWLQWGRGHVTAERKGAGYYPKEISLASMGPRSCDRGKQGWVPDPDAPRMGLQWGRGHVTAERIVSHHYTVRTASFNGAAVM